MGFAGIVSHVILGLALVSVAGHAIDTYFDNEARLDEARAVRRAIDAERTNARFEGAMFCYNSVLDRAYFNATLVGGVELDASAFSFTVDGVPHLDFFATIDGVDDAILWLPEEEANFTLDNVASDPDRIVGYTERGVPVFAEEYECPMLSSIVMTPSSADLAIGGSLTFTAAGFDQFGDPFPVTAYSWSATGGAIVELTGTTATFTAGTTSGSFVVQATSSGITGTATITIRPDPPASIAIAPTTADVAAGTARTFVATVYDAYGNVNTTAPVTWATNAGTVSTSGVLTAQTTAQSGRTVTATTGSYSASATVNIVPTAMSRIVVSPAAPTVLTSTSLTFTAAAYDFYGNAITNATFTWSATRGSIASTGNYTAPATVGTDTVTATTGSIWGQTNLTVDRWVRVSALATFKNGAAATSFVRGTDTVEARATIVDHNGLVVSGASVTIEFVNPDADVKSTGTGTTNGSGIGSASYAMPNGAKMGTWVARVTSVSGANLTYVSGQNVVTQVNFTVTN